MYLKFQHFLTVIEFNTKFEEKRVGRSPQEILTRPTLLAFRAQYEGKMELSHHMVSFFLVSARLIMLS
jgi:hypothetical protein